MSAADIESALAQSGIGEGGHDETGSDDHDDHHLHHQSAMLIDEDVHSMHQTTVIATDPTTHIIALEHQTGAAKHNKNDPPIECVWYSSLQTRSRGFILFWGCHQK